MGRFITTSNSTLVNLDHVAKTKNYPADKPGRTDLIDQNGIVLGTLYGEIDERRFCGGLIPAPPDFKLVFFFYEDDEAVTTEQTILAFEVGEEVIPFTFYGQPSGDFPWAIKAPDGTLCNPFERDWKDLDEFRKYHLEHARAYEADKKKGLTP